MKVQSEGEKDYIAYLDNKGIEDFVTFSNLGGDPVPSEDLFLLINNPEKKSCSFFLKGKNDIYVKKNREYVFIGAFQALERTKTGNILIVRKDDDEELLYDCETGQLVFVPIEGESHWVNSTGCISRRYPWMHTNEICSEVYLRGQDGLYHSSGRIFCGQR